jgi:branched-chain amino acid transport system ATP-binding protein
MGFIPYSGELYFGGMALDGLKTYQRAAGGIGLVPEGRRVFKTLTVQDNLIVGGSGSHASRSKVTPRIYDLFPLLYDRRNQTAGTMSGGEQQMLAIGRALIGEPKLLMLDEPSLGLAPAVIPLVYGAIDEIRKQGVSILLVEQNSVVALEATARGYVLDLGCVRVSGSSEELRSDPEVAAAYLG